MIKHSTLGTNNFDIRIAQTCTYRSDITPSCYFSPRRPSIRSTIHTTEEYQKLWNLGGNQPCWLCARLEITIELCTAVNSIKPKATIVPYGNRWARGFKHTAAVGDINIIATIKAGQIHVFCRNRQWQPVWDMVNAAHTVEAFPRVRIVYTSSTRPVRDILYVPVHNIKCRGNPQL